MPERTARLTRTGVSWWRAAPFAMMVAAPAFTGAGAAGQSVLDRTPNTAGTWSLVRWSPLFVFTHRFEFVAGGDELINVPTLQLALGLPAPRSLGLTFGVDYTSNGESVPERAGGNETQWWLRLAVPNAGFLHPSVMAAYNTAARSVDGAIGVRAPLGPLTLLAEARGFSDRFGSGDAGSAGALGASLRLTRYFAVQGDVASAFTDDAGEAWSAGVAIAIPGSPHSFSLHATNSGATTLQGTSREKLVGPQDVRYGFAFTVPFGGAERWRRVIAGDPERPVMTTGDVRADTSAASVRIIDLAFTPMELRIPAGTAVTWQNDDPVVHTVTADDGDWGSELIRSGESWSRTFDEPGRYSYHCEPHPQMRGVVIVE